MSKSAFSLREMRSSDLDLVLSWRNSPRIRNSSYNDQLIQREDHLAWFSKLQESSDRVCLIFEIDHTPAGVIQFFDISRVEHKCKWGFYLGREDLPVGTGSKMGQLALDYAFNTLGVDCVLGEALSNNDRSIQFHKKLGFVQDGLIERSLHRDGSWIDIHLFSVERNSWKKKGHQAA